MKNIHFPGLTGILNFNFQHFPGQIWTMELTIPGLWKGMETLYLMSKAKLKSNNLQITNQLMNTIKNQNASINVSVSFRSL